MAGPLDTATDPDLARLALRQYLSPAFPTGAFTHSSGLEWAMAHGTGRAEVAEWIADWLRFGGGWSDAVLLSLALREGADLVALDDMGRALCLSAERLTETADQGAAFAATAAALTGAPQPDAILPVAVARATRPLGLPAPEVIAAYLHGASANLIHAAMRFLPMGQRQGQIILAGLAPLIIAIATRAACATPDDLGTSALGADMAAFSHETMETRIFRT